MEPIIETLNGKKLVTFNIVWNRIPIKLVFKPNYFLNVISHLEVNANEPLPITETGYRSIWLAPNFDYRNIVSLVVDELNLMSKTKDWKNYLKTKVEQEKSKQQYKLF